MFWHRLPEREFNNLKGLLWEKVDEFTHDECKNELWMRSFRVNLSAVEGGIQRTVQENLRGLTEAAPNTKRGA
jgi:hypothetical protein